MSVLDVQGPGGPPPVVETEEERVARVQREAVVVARADADIDAGRGIEVEELEAWLDGLDRDDRAPVPAGPGRRHVP